MSYKTVLVAAIVIATAIISMGAPAEKRQRRNIEPKLINLNDALNVTTCPMYTHRNEDKHRVPRVVKELKCRNVETRKWCEERGIEKAECCAGHHQRCKEVRDSVLVYDLLNKVYKTETFSVGCVCIVQNITRANHIS